MSRFPFPHPYGWFQVAYPDDLEPGGVKSLHFWSTDLVLWRDEAGEYHLQDAFCPHLGAHLGVGGSVQDGAISCPFHGWRWNMEGKNTFVPGRHLFSEESLRAQEIDLAPCRVETWGGCAFINFDDKAPPLRESLEPFASYCEARGVADMRTLWWYSGVLPVNWKLAMEAFMEGYHRNRTHPQLYVRLGAYKGLHELIASMPALKPTLQDIRNKEKDSNLKAMYSLIQ